MKIYKKYLYVLLSCVLMLQFVSVPVAGTHLKPYMIVSVLLFFILVTNNDFQVRKFHTFETLWLFTYILSAMSIVYASDSKLALQLALGECVLVAFFLTFRLILIRNVDVDRVLFRCFSVFVYLSLAIYIIGCVQFFVFGNSSILSQELNDHSYRVWGCYFEGDTFPRFMGLSESPNNYEYFAITILWWSVWKKKSFLAFVTLITILLTISTTAIVVLSITGCIYLLFKRKLSLSFVILISIIFYIGYSLALDNDYIQGMIELRKARNETGSGRFELWDATMNKIEDHPLLGYGLNQFRAVLPSSGKASAHNNILETLLSTGLIGLIIYIAFLFSFVVYSIKQSRYYKDPFFFLMSIAFILFGMANNTLTIEFVPFLLALFCSYGIHKKANYINSRY